MALFLILVSALAVYKFQHPWVFIPTLVLIWGLIALSIIDVRYQVLPDRYTLPLLWLGLLCNAFHLLVSPTAAILGAVFGYISLWSFAKLYKLIRHKDGMGYGDFKLFALLGAWLGIESLPFILFIAVFSALIFYAVLFLKQHSPLQSRLAFGPFLALGGMILLFGQYSL